MSVHINWVLEIVNWLSLPVLAVLALVFLFRRTQRSFPLFFAYILGALLISIVRLSAYSVWSSHSYFYVYWASEAVMSLLAWIAIYEVFVCRLFTGFYKTSFYRFLFPAAALVVMVGTFSITLMVRGEPHFSVESRIFEFVRGIILIFFVALMLFMGRQWSRYELGVSLGFGIDIIFSLVRSAEWSRAHYVTQANLLSLIAWDVACCIWLVCFWKADSRTYEPPDAQITPAIVNQAQTWQEMLRTWLRKN